jgi:hypothetical protein
MERHERETGYAGGVNELHSFKQEVGQPSTTTCGIQHEDTARAYIRHGGPPDVPNTNMGNEYTVSNIHA